MKQKPKPTTTTTNWYYFTLRSLDVDVDVGSDVVPNWHSFVRSPTLCYALSRAFALAIYAYALSIAVYCMCMCVLLFCGFHLPYGLLICSKVGQNKFRFIEHTNNKASGSLLSVRARFGSAPIRPRIWSSLALGSGRGRGVKRGNDNLLLPSKKQYDALDCVWGRVPLSALWGLYVRHAEWFMQLQQSMEYKNKTEKLLKHIPLLIYSYCLFTKNYKPLIGFFLLKRFFDMFLIYCWKELINVKYNFTITSAFKCQQKC